MANCAYCDGGELLSAFGFEIMALEASKVHLFREQSHKGRVIVAGLKHVSDITALDDAERDAFFRDLNRVARALHRLYAPDKINFGAYGDTGCHMHFHLVPKYKADPFEWGTTFDMNPKRVFLSDEAYMEMIREIKAELSL